MSKPALSESEEAQAKMKSRGTNWPDYARALVRRGEVTVWFDEDFLRGHWHGRSTGNRGLPLKYSEAAIQGWLMRKAVLALPYRAGEGLARSRMGLLGRAFPGPDHPQLSRRGQRRQVVIPRRERLGPVPLVGEATGLQVDGEGEWKVRQHGAGQRRTGRKVQLAVDGTAKDVIGVEGPTGEWTDGEVFEGLLEQVEGTLEQSDGDGAYDPRHAYAVAASRTAKLVVPPREHAIRWEDGHPRTDALQQRAEQGTAEWKRPTGDHRRRLAENAMSRLKQLFGDSLASRLFEPQVTEVHARIAAMHVMTYLGMPISVRVGGMPS